jgi:hypothetical protein
MPNPQAGGPPLVGCPRLLIQYIRSYPPYLEAVSSIRNLRTRHAAVTRDPPNMAGFELVNGFIDTHTHDSELQAITAPPLISTIYKSPQHPLWLFQPAVSSSAVPWQRVLIVEIPQLHALRSPLYRLPYRTDLIAQIVFKITLRHGPSTNASFSTIPQLLRVYSLLWERVYRAVA